MTGPVYQVGYVVVVVIVVVVAEDLAAFVLVPRP